MSYHGCKRFLKDINEFDETSTYDKNLKNQLLVLSEKHHRKIRDIQRQIKDIDGDYLSIGNK